MPILGLIASSTRQGLSTNSYESIATPTISGSSNFVEFTSIPQTYKHLQIRFSVLTNTTNADILLYVNNVTSAGSYTYHELRSNGSTVTASGNANMSHYYVATNATSATYPCVGVVDIFDYADTNKITTTRTISGKDENGGGTVQILTGMNKVTTAITSMKFDCTSTIDTKSKIALYGIKG